MRSWQSGNGCRCKNGRKREGKSIFAFKNFHRHYGFSIPADFGVCWLNLRSLGSCSFNCDMECLGNSWKYILFVYSNSPIWKDVIEKEVIPAIVDKTIVLNWSERKTWQPSLAVWAFHYFGGRRNFNPLAIVFRPFKLNQTFRFYEAFQDYKHGKKEKFKKLRTGLLHFVR